MVKTDFFGDLFSAHSIEWTQLCSLWLQGKDYQAPKAKHRVSFFCLCVRLWHYRGIVLCIIELPGILCHWDLTVVIASISRVSGQDFLKVNVGFIGPCLYWAALLCNTDEVNIITIGMDWVNNICCPHLKNSLNIWIWQWESEDFPFSHHMASPLSMTLVIWHCCVHLAVCVLWWALEIPAFWNSPSEGS